MANAVKVSEIFEQASIAFGRLAQMTINLKSSQLANQQSGENKPEKSKWSNEELHNLKEAIGRFGKDISAIAERIENKSVSEIQEKIRSNEFAKENITEEKLESIAEKPVISTQSGRRKQALVKQSANVPNEDNYPTEEALEADELNTSYHSTAGSNSGAVSRVSSVKRPMSTALEENNLMSYSKLPRRERSQNMAELIAAEKASMYEDYSDIDELDNAPVSDDGEEHFYDE